MHTTPAVVDHPAGLVVARSHGWWVRNWKWVVPVGVAAIVSVVVAVCLGVLALIFGLMRQTEVYQTALDEAQGAPQVIERLGTPIEDGFLVTGNIEVNPSSGYADLAIPIEGPDGRGVIHVEIGHPLRCPGVEIASRFDIHLFARSAVVLRVSYDGRRPIAIGARRSRWTWWRESAIDVSGGRHSVR
jgi:hypothetical protein